VIQTRVEHGQLLSPFCAYNSTVKFLLTPVGSAGDNYPFLGLGDRLRRRGHEVTVVTGEHFAPLVRGLGLGYVQVGTEEEYLSTLNNPDLFHARRGFQTVMQLVMEHNRRLFDVVERFRNDNPDGVVVAASLDFVSRAMQDKHGLRVVSIHLQPAMMRSIHTMPTNGRFNMSRLPTFIKRFGWKFIDWLLLDRFAGPIANNQREKLGLPPVKHIFGGYVHSPLLSIGLWPEWFGPRQPDWPGQFRLTNFPLFDVAEAQPVSAEVNDFLNSGEPPVVFTPGSAMVRGHEFFAVAAQACLQIGRRAVLLTRHAEQIPRDLPRTIRHFSFAPLTKILSRCAALVHHGGVGTMSAALAAGVPQLIMPMSHDQPDNAWHVRRLGVGERVFPRQFKAARVAKTLAAMLDSADMGRRCTEIAQQCARVDGLAAACELIEAAVSSGRAPR
jgi:UDP:flavonoid glycosyltransferase YjiC (YdhE family)